MAIEKSDWRYNYRYYYYDDYYFYYGAPVYYTDPWLCSYDDGYYGDFGPSPYWDGPYVMDPLLMGGGFMIMANPFDHNYINQRDFSGAIFDGFYTDSQGLRVGLDDMADFAGGDIDMIGTDIKQIAPSIDEDPIVVNQAFKSDFD